MKKVSEEHKRAVRAAAAKRYRAKNPGKAAMYALRYREKNREKVNAARRVNGTAYAQTFRARNPEKHKESCKKQKLKTRGFTLELYRAALDAQHNRCAICSTDFVGAPPYSVHADHDHSTGKPRGVLCNKCNTGLGFFGDSTERMLAAVRYLEQPTLPQ